MTNYKRYYLHFINNYRRIIHRIEQGSPRTKIYFQTLLPVNSTFEKLKSHYQPGRIININTQLRKLVVDEHIILIDLFPHFTDQQGRLRSSLTFDGVHLTKEGYDIWVQVLKKGGFLQ